MMCILEVMHVWLVSYMIFRANNLNDLTDPRSEMNYFHWKNIKDKEDLEKILTGEGLIVNSGARDVILWPDIYQYVAPSAATIFYSIVRSIFPN